MDNLISLKYPIYNKETGVLGYWTNNAKIGARIDIDGKTCVISGNKEGLISLAQHIVSLAQDGAPIGSHYHLDEFNGLEEASNELIFEKNL